MKINNLKERKEYNIKDIDAHTAIFYFFKATSFSEILSKSGSLIPVCGAKRNSCCSGLLISAAWRASQPKEFLQHPILIQFLLINSYIKCLMKQIKGF